MDNSSIIHSQLVFSLFGISFFTVPVRHAIFLDRYRVSRTILLIPLPRVSSFRLKTVLDAPAPTNIRAEQCDSRLTRVLREESLHSHGESAWKQRLDVKKSLISSVFPLKLRAVQLCKWRKKSGSKKRPSNPPCLPQSLVSLIRSSVSSYRLYPAPALPLPPSLRPNIAIFKYCLDRGWGGGCSLARRAASPKKDGIQRMPLSNSFAHPITFRRDVEKFIEGRVRDRNPERSRMNELCRQIPRSALEGSRGALLTCPM